jgi:hypothetical protein
MRRALRRVSTGWRGAAHFGDIRTRPKGLVSATVRAMSSENSTHMSTTPMTTRPWRPKWWAIAAGILLLALHLAAVKARSARAVRALRQASTPAPTTAMNSNQAPCTTPDQPTTGDSEEAPATLARARGVLLFLLQSTFNAVLAALAAVVIGNLLASPSPAPVTRSACYYLTVPDAPVVEERPTVRPAARGKPAQLTMDPASVGTCALCEPVWRFERATGRPLEVVEIFAAPPGSRAALPNVLVNPVDAVPPDVLSTPG